MYITLYTVLATLGLTVWHNRSLPWLIAALLFLLWFMGARYYVGCDFTGYLNRFINIPANTRLSDAITEHEPGFELLITAISTSGLDYMWLNISATAVILLGYYIFLRNHYNPLMILALLFPIMIVQLSMSGIRQAIAVSFLLVSTVYFMRGKRVLTATWILLGAQFHTSVVVFLPIALLAGKNISTTRLAISSALLAPVVILFIGSRVEVYQDRYINQLYGDISSGGAYIRYGLSLLPAILFLIYQTRMKSAFPKQFLLFRLFSFLIIALLPIGFFSSLALHRFNFYVMPLSIAILVATSNVVLPRSQIMFARLMPVLLYGGYAVFWNLLSRHAVQCYRPYQNYFLL